MRKSILTLSLASTLALSACMTTTDQQMLAGGLAGGAVGLISAKALGANDNWVVLATLAGATVGTLVARNAATNECAYANGDGTYRTGPCP